MFENVGKKIMKLAKILAVLDIIGAVILTCVYLYELEFLAVILGVAVGFVSVISCWFVYAFGQIVDDVHRMTKGDEVETVKAEDIPEL